MRAWLNGATAELQASFDVWTELAARFEGGRLCDEAEMRRWVATLVDGEAQDELERIRLAPQPEPQKTQAQERARRRVANGGCAQRGST